MALFSYHGGIPAVLPEPLIGVSVDRLKELGYSGPFPAPSFNPRTQKPEWQGQEWRIVDLPAEDIEQAERKRLLSRADWQGFSLALMNSQAYGKARQAAMTNMQANVAAIELTTMLADARLGNVNLDAINATFATIGQFMNMSDEDKAELADIANRHGLSMFLSSFPALANDLNEMTGGVAMTLSHD